MEGPCRVRTSATLEVRRAEKRRRKMQVAGRFAPPTRELLRPENVMPTLQAKNYRFTTSLPHDTLKRWVDLGVLYPQIADRVLTCPECSAMPTFHKGCKGCGGINVASERLIHHYACAHVGRVSEFEQASCIGCPKCRAKNLIVGADFEYLNGPFVCGDCGWNDTDLELVGYCRVCHLRFPSSMCSEEELVGYHVNRLDPLVLIDAI